MENIDSGTWPVQQPNGSYYQQDFDLESVDIYTGSGDPIKIRNLVVELSFFEDIYSFAVSGHVIIRDALGILEKVKIDGTQIINIVYGKTKSMPDVQKNNRKYRIYKSDKSPIANHTSEFLTIYFCSEALMISEQIKISKSYSGENAKLIATNKENNEGIINQILYNNLMVSKDRVETIEKTYGVYDFIIGNLKPLEAISWLSMYSRPDDSQIGADMLFFETKNGFNFRSLQSMYKDPPHATYKWQPKNVDSNFEGGFSDGVTTVLDLQFVKVFDSLNETSSGTYANRLISIDPLTKTYKVTDFSYEEDLLQNNGKNKPTTLNGNAVTGFANNRFGIDQTSSFNSKVKVVVGNSNRPLLTLVKNNPGSVEKDIFIETWVPYRTSQISLANYTVLKLLIPGDSDMTAGKTIYLNMFSLAVDSNNNRQLDQYFSGKYLVSAVRHIIQADNTYQTVVEIAKESSKLQFDSPDSTSATYQRTITEI